MTSYSTLCYFNNPTKVQYKSSEREKDFTSVFYLIHSLEVPVLCNDTQEKAIRAARIFREYWNLQFNGRTDWGEKSDTKTATEPVQSVSSSEASTQSVNADELYERVVRIEEMLTVIMKQLNCDVPTSNVTLHPATVRERLETKQPSSIRLWHLLNHWQNRNDTRPSAGMRLPRCRRLNERSYSNRLTITLIIGGYSLQSISHRTAGSLTSRDRALNSFTE